MQFWKKKVSYINNLWINWLIITRYAKYNHDQNSLMFTNTYIISNWKIILILYLWCNYIVFCFRAEFRRVTEMSKCRQDGGSPLLKGLLLLFPSNLANFQYILGILQFFCVLTLFVWPNNYDYIISIWPTEYGVLNMFIKCIRVKWFTMETEGFPVFMPYSWNLSY